MSDVTKIEWASSTGNPWIGCTKVSPGCKNCYAEALDVQRFSKTMGGGTKENPVSHWGPGAPRFRTKGFWKDALKWNAGAGKAAVVSNTFKQRPRIFPSLCDWLDDEVPIEWLADFLKLIHDTPNLDWLLLTKRPELFAHRLHHVAHLKNELAIRWHMLQEPPQNVWIGTSVEDQQRADERIPALLKIPAKIRFLSCEPLLGRIDLNLRSRVFNFPQHIGKSGAVFNREDLPFHWVIPGGESGRGSREHRIEWTRSIVQQCQAFGVPCFVKQMGAFPTVASQGEWHTPAYHFLHNPACSDRLLVKLAHPKGGDPSEWPEDLRVREFPC